MITQNTSTTPAAATTQTPVDDFESVFAEITREEPADATKAAATAAAATAAADGAAGDSANDKAGAATDAAGTAAAGATEAAAGTDAAAATAAAAETAAGAAKPAEELAAAQARIAELEAAVAAATKKPDATPAADAGGGEAKPATEGAASDPMAEVQWRKPNDKEGVVLENFRKEWPEVAEAMQTQLQIDIYNTVQYVFAALKKEYGPRFQRLDDVADAVGEMITLGDLRGRNNDYDELHEAVVQWTDTLNGFQKKAAKAVLEGGTAEEVTELFAEYRKAHPKAPVIVAGTDTAPAGSKAVKGKTELSAAAKKAANALSVVDSKRTSATTTVDPDDFDAAWQEATR